MRRTVALLLFFIFVLSFAGCKTNEKTVYETDYGTSSVYTKEDMDQAVELIKKEFAKWEGCELHSITYAGDENNNEKNIKWMNELEKANDNKETFTQCIMFKSDFHSPIENAGAFNPDKEYTNWQWWLARSENGKWKLMTWGY